MLNVQVPSEAQHARAHASRLTTYSLAEIHQAAAELTDADAQYERTVNEAWSILQPYRTHLFSDLAIERSGGPLADLQSALLEDQPSCDWTGHHSGETWPVRKWRRLSAQRRSRVRKIERLIIAAQKEIAA